MKIHKETLQITTSDEFDVTDITADVEKVVLTSGIAEGYVIVYSPHTTVAVIVNEKETGLLTDLRKTLDRLIPAHESYLHDDFSIRTENMHEGETRNAHSHLRQILGGRTSESLLVSEGGLVLGRWQRVMVVEFDRPKDREVLIQVCGT